MNKKVGKMSKEVNTNRGYYQPGKNMSSNSFSDGSVSRSYTRDDLPDAVNPTFTKDVDMRQLNYATTNCVTASYDSTWSSNTREAIRDPMNTFNPYPTNSSYIGEATNLLDKEQYNYGRSNGIQRPVSTSKVVRSTYADSFVTYNINNKDPMPTSQPQTMERDPGSDIVYPMPIKHYSTSKSAPDSNISSGQSSWQNKGINASIRVIPAAELKNRPQNPDDPRFVLLPKEPTFNVKIIGGVRIAQQVIKISYHKSLKNTDVYTIGRKGGSCKKALAEGKRKRALWWIRQGKTVEEAILLSLRPYHEIYDEVLEKKHSWGTPMMIRNLIEQINKEGVYNPLIGRPQVNDSETEDDSIDEATEQLIKPQYNQSNPSFNNKLGMNLQQNLGKHSNSFMLGTLLSQDNIRNLQTENSSSERASYDPKSHFLKSHTDRNSSLPVNSATFTDLIHTKSDNRSLSSLEEHDKQPVNSKPVSELLRTKRDNPYTKVNTESKTIGLKDITGAALRRYNYWLKVGKTPEVAKALCVLRMDQIPLYHKIKGTMGTLKKFVKTRQKQVKFSKSRSVACLPACPARMLDKAVSCDINDFTESFCVDNPQGESESFMPENTEGSACGLGNPNTSKTQVYLNELEQFTKSLKHGSTNYKKIFESVAIDKYRWWRHVGRTIKEAQVMCLQPFNYYPKEREEGVKIIDFKTYILENAVNHNIADGTAKCPTEFKGHKKIRYNFWIKLGKTPKEAIDLTLQDSGAQRRKRQYMERAKKREYLSTLRSSCHKCTSYTQTSQNKNNCDSSSVSIIPTIEEDFTMASFDYCDVAKNNIRTYAKSDNNAKKQVGQAKQLTNTELIYFERWKNQYKSEEEARNKSMAVSEFLNRIPSNEKEKYISSYTYDGSKSNIPDISHNLRLDEIPNKQIFGENTIKTDTMAETNFPQNIVVAQEGHNLPITENLVLPSNVIRSEQGEFKVCIKANKVNMDFVDLEAIKKSLNLCIDDKDGIKIKSFNKRQNIVIITCLNDQTRDWLDKQIPTLVPWENAQLEIIDEDEVPMDILARFFIPFATEAECSSVTPEQFMQQLHEENPDVGCDRWHVLKFETKTVPIGFYVVGCIDNKSRDVLKSKTFKLKWFYQRNIKVSISSKKKKNKGESGARAVLFVPNVPECRLHSSHEYLLNKLHKRNPTIGCDRWTIVQKRIKPDGAVLLVRLNNVSKQIVENLKQLRWYRCQKIVITIVPIYVDIDLPINNENKHLRNIPQNEIKKTLINKLNFFNPLFGCLQWLVVQLQDKIDEWHLTCKINEQCHQMLIKSDYKLYWYGGRRLEIKLGTVPELEMYGLKNDIKHSKKLATSHQPKDHVPKINLNQIASGSLLSPQLTEERLTKIPECEKPDRRQEYLGSVGFGDKEDTPQERYSHGIRRYDEDRVSSSDDRYILKSNRDDYYPNSEHRNIENVDYNNDDCYQNYNNNENRLEENERRQTSYQNSIVNPDPRSDDEYLHQNIEDYHFDQHLHDSANTREIDNVREERKFDSRERHYDREERQFDREEKDFDRGERDFDRVDRHFDREENNLYREERNFNTEEKYYGREGMNFERGQRYFDREKSHKDGARLDFEHRSRQETEYSRRECSPDYQNRSKYAVRMKLSQSRDDQREQNLPHLRPEHREALHYISESLNQNKVARDREDRRLDDRIHRLNKELADYHDRERHYHESSSYSNRDRQNSRPSFNEPSRRRRR